MGGLTFANLAFRKDLLNKKGSIILRANDIFNSRLNSALGDINGFAFSRKFISPSSRYLFLTFKYNFKFGNKKLANKNRLRKQRKYTKQS